MEILHHMVYNFIILLLSLLWFRTLHFLECQLYWYRILPLRKSNLRYWGRTFVKLGLVYLYSNHFLFPSRMNKRNKDFIFEKCILSICLFTFYTKHLTHDIFVLMGTDIIFNNKKDLQRKVWRRKVNYKLPVTRKKLRKQQKNCPTIWEVRV